MRKSSNLKGEGYLTSSVSVILLGIPALKSASQSPLLLLCLILGMIMSVAGMGLRWRSHRVEQHVKDRELRSIAREPQAPTITASTGRS